MLFLGVFPGFYVQGYVLCNAPDEDSARMSMDLKIAEYWRERFGLNPDTSSDAPPTVHKIIMWNPDLPGAGLISDGDC